MTGGPVDRNFDYLQMSTGGPFTDLADPEGDSITGALLATDVDCSSNTAVFRGMRQLSGSGCLTDDFWVVGFIVLDRL